MKSVSFIVPAHNEERLLGRTLDALEATVAVLAHPSEVIVVDDASTDGTARIARSRGARVIPVNLRHIAAVRNAGARAASGDYLFFVDADTVVNEPVVTAALKALDRGVVGGGARVQWDGQMPFWARIAEVLTLFWMRVGRLAAGCFFFCTRTAFETAGGFEERVYASEELFLSRALKRQGRFVLLSEPVTTSARKFRTYSAREMLGMIRALGWRPWRALRERERLDLWYGERRHDR
jgi:glycosyltransferase involved in cell wall biosynthesis